MRIKPVDPSAVIRDPHTKRVIPPEGDNVPDTTFFVHLTRAHAPYDAECYLHDGKGWTRHLSNGQVVRVGEDGQVIRTPDDTTSPVGNEPTRPLTTRS